MNIKQPNFELVSDDDFDREHEEPDKEIKEDFARLTDTNIERLGPHVLARIVNHFRGQLLFKYCHTNYGTKHLKTNETF